MELGWAIARELAREGCRVAISAPLIVRAPRRGAGGQLGIHLGH